MTWKVDFAYQVEGKAERLIIPDEALKGGSLFLAPEFEELAARRRCLLDDLKRCLSRDPYGDIIGTCSAVRQEGFRRNVSVMVSTLQDEVEACHVWWCRVTNIEILDIAFTPRF